MIFRHIYKLTHTYAQSYLDNYNDWLINFNSILKLLCYMKVIKSFSQWKLIKLKYELLASIISISYFEEVQYMIIYFNLDIYHYFNLLTTLLPTAAWSLLFNYSANLWSLFFFFSSSSSLLVVPLFIPNLIALSCLLTSYSPLDS